MCSDVSSAEEPQEDVVTNTMSLPDLLSCASESTGHLDFFGVPYAITMDLQNIYSQANTSFFIDRIHDMSQEGFEGGLSGGNAVYQSRPNMGEDTIDIALTRACQCRHNAGSIAYDIAHATGRLGSLGQQHQL